jgi:hypothetical protein
MYRVSFSLFGACLLFCGIAAFATDGPNDPARPTIATADASVKTAEGAEPATATADAANPPANVEAASIKFTFEERIRNEDWNNIEDFNSANDDERRQVRYRTRARLKYGSAPVDFVVGLNDEFNKKYALKPADIKADRLNMDEVILEYLYLNIKKLPVPGLSLSVGRQDIMRGEGFLFFDGSSGDGSRTQYFNAASINYQHAKSKIELLGILDPKLDRFFGIIHDQKKYLNEWDEQGVGAYYTDRNHKNTDWDVYYFYKKEINDYRAKTNYQFQPNRGVNTLGGRLVERLPEGWSITAEYAGQWGNQHANPYAVPAGQTAATGQSAEDIRAWGGFGYVKKTFATAWKPYIQVGFWGFSGDDPNNKKTLKGFDPLFSRWPKWSELYLYSLVFERGVAYWTNNMLEQVEVGATPVKGLNLRATVYEEKAFHPFQPFQTNTSQLHFGTGTHRGENYQVLADHTFNEHWRAHILYENFSPGDFYKYQPDSFFFRAQVNWTVTKNLINFHKH